MNVVLAHTRYLEAGGEDVAFAAECELLERAGHQVTTFTASNSELTRYSKSGMAARTLWNEPVRRELAELARRVKPDVIHFHNTFPWFSPASYYAAGRAVAVVQTLHNYRLVCPEALLVRAGSTCEACVGRFPWPGIAHGCYRSSRTATAAVAAMVQLHRVALTWRRRVHAYIALSSYARSLFVRGGLPAERIHVKPNFVDPDPGRGAHAGEHYLFVGRLVEQKGVRVLLDAWSRLERPPRLRIIGEGPMSDWVREQAEHLEGVEFAGPLPRARVLEEMRQARALIFPSLSQECCPFTMLEAFATGLPVLCSRIRNLQDLVREGVNGWLFNPGHAGELCAMVRRAEERVGERQALGSAARALWESDFTATTNSARLEAVYEAALARAGAT